MPTPAPLASPCRGPSDGEWAQSLPGPKDLNWNPFPVGSPETRLQLQTSPGLPSILSEAGSIGPQNAIKMVPLIAWWSPPQSSLGLRCAEAGLGTAGHQACWKVNPALCCHPWQSLVPSMKRPGRKAPARLGAQVPAPCATLELSVPSGFQGNRLTQCTWAVFLERRPLSPPPLSLPFFLMCAHSSLHPVGS